MRKVYLFIISFLIFSFGIFFFKNYFLGTYETDINNHIENKYIEPTIEKTSYQEINLETAQEKENKLLDNKKKEIIKNIYKISFLYFPNDFASLISSYKNSFKGFLDASFINNKIDVLDVEFYKDKNDVRGKMKDRSIKLFGVKQMGVPELNAVGIHEFAHYIDIYFLEKQVFTDISDYFYNISWDGIKVLKPGLTQNDFVSGYAMTNKYEDFAETFTYYMLYNEDFQNKSKNSNILREKYNFFSKYIFREGQFEGTNFGTSGKVESYYRDITKIEFSLEKFLDFLKN